jgi:hypothetical protein
MHERVNLICCSHHRKPYGLHKHAKKKKGLGFEEERNINCIQMKLNVYIPLKVAQGRTKLK